MSAYMIPMYQRIAKSYRRLADETDDPKAKADFLNIAECYEVLADLSESNAEGL